MDERWVGKVIIDGVGAEVKKAEDGPVPGYRDFRSIRILASSQGWEKWEKKKEKEKTLEIISKIFLHFFKLYLKQIIGNVLDSVDVEYWVDFPLFFEGFCHLWYLPIEKY